MDDRQLFTREDVLQIICEEEDDEGPPEIMFPGSDEEFGLYDDDDENDDEPRHDDTINKHKLNLTDNDLSCSDQDFGSSVSTIPQILPHIPDGINNILITTTSVQQNSPVLTISQESDDITKPTDDSPESSRQISSEKKVKWSNDLRRIEVDPFTAPTGPTLTLPTCPITTFLLFFTESLFELIAVETNRYAQTCMGEEEYTKWTNVTIDELKAYIGFKILMGIIRLPSLYDYWKKDPYYHYGPIANRISRDRFMEIGRYLHFVDNSTLAPPGSDEYDRLGKVRPVLEQLSKQFTALYNPSRDCSIDEAMIPFKGRSSMKQYIPKKPIKRGFKVWTRADSKNGFVSEFQVYVGKKKEVERRLGARVVKDLTRKIVGKNHHVYCDNFFTSIPLFQDLLDDKICACGTIRSNREFFPQDFKSDLKKGFKKRGEYKLLQSGNLVIALWQDTKVFTAISTNSQPNEIVEVKRKQKNGEKQLVQCPELIAKYNENMGGVDKNDQLRQYYSIRARGRKCYKYIAYFSIDLAITNSYIFHSLLSEPTFCNLKDFRLNLATQLIGSYNSRKRAGRPSILPSKKFCQSHFPKKPNDKRYRCHYCYTYKKIRKDTQWYCEDCSIHLCHTGKSDDCFILYHTQYL